MADKTGDKLQSAVTEARQWIEAVTGRTLVGEFREALEDGVVLCELINELKPNSIRKINLKNVAIAHLDNLKQFLTGCENLGLKDSQLFDLTDLQAPGTLRMKSGGVKHTTAERRLRNVVITLYWLGRKVAQTPAYNGPQLNLEAFKEILDIPNQNFYLRGYDNGSSPVPPGTNNYSNRSPQLPKASNSALPKPTITAPVKLEDTRENGRRDSRDISPDELLANIESAVAELHLDYQTINGGNSSPEVGQLSAVVRNKSTPSPSFSTPSPVPLYAEESVLFTAKVVAVNGTFGLQIIGGADTSVPAQIELMLPGGPAESSGLRPNDLIVSIDSQDVSRYNHFDLISLIKQSSSKGYVTIGVVRRRSQDSPNRVEVEEEEQIKPFERTESQIIWQEEHAERERQRQEVARLYKGRPTEPQPPKEDTMKTDQEVEVEEEEENWEEMLDQQLKWQSAGATDPMEDLQQQLAALRELSERKPSPGTTAMSSIKPFSPEQEVKIQEERKVEVTMEETPNVEVTHEEVEAREGDGKEETTPSDEEEETTPVASESEEEEEIKENVRGEGEGKEADPVIPVYPEYIPTATASIMEDDPFAPLKTDSTQSELLQEVLSASIANRFGTQSQFSATSFVGTSAAAAPSAGVTNGTKRSSPPPSLRREASPRVRQFSTPNARVVSMEFEGESEEIQGGVRVKAVQKTRWTPEMKENRRVIPPPTNRSASLAVVPSSYSKDDRGYEKHEVVMTDVRGRSFSYEKAEAHKVQQTNRPHSGQVQASNKKHPSCNRCKSSITNGPMVSIPARKIHFHSKCLICCVCRQPLTLSRGNTTVLLRHSLPHCDSCYSTDNGIKATTC